MLNTQSKLGVQLNSVELILDILSVQPAAAVCIVLFNSATKMFKIL